MRRFLILSSAILFSTLSVISLGASSVNAASYADDLTVSDTIKIAPSSSSGLNSGEDEYFDYGTQWLSKFKEAFDNDYFGNNQTCTNDLSFKTKVTNSTNWKSWAISLGHTSGTTVNFERAYSQITLHFLTQDDSGKPSLNYGNDVSYYGIRASNYMSVSLRLNSSNQPIIDSCEKTPPTYSSTVTYYQVDQGGIYHTQYLNGYAYRLVFAYNFDINYPTGYDGDTIPDIYTPPDTHLEYGIHFTIDNVYKDTFKAQYKSFYTKPENVRGIQGPLQIMWKISDPDKPNPNIVPEAETVCGPIVLDIDEPFTDRHCTKGTLTDKNYLVSAIPVPPTIQGYKLESLTTVLKVDFSRVTTGYSSEKCTQGVTGVGIGIWCNEKEVYEDCTTYGMDVIAGISCAFRNFGVFLLEIATFLFVPNYSTVSNELQSMTNTIKTSLGFLYSPIDFIVQVFKLLVDQGQNPTGQTCYIGSFSFFGSTSAPFYMCAWRNQLPQLWSLMQIAIQGGIAVGFSVAFWRKFMGFFGNHIEDDEIGEREDLSGYEWVDERTGERGPIGGRKK